MIKYKTHTIIFHILSLWKKPPFPHEILRKFHYLTCHIHPLFLFIIHFLCVYTRTTMPDDTSEIIIFVLVIPCRARRRSTSENKGVRYGASITLSLSGCLITNLFDFFVLFFTVVVIHTHARLNWTRFLYIYHSCYFACLHASLISHETAAVEQH